MTAMLRVVVLALLAACGTPPRHVEPPRTAPPVPVVAPAVPIVRGDAPAGGARAPHAGAIVLVAATPDGTAALTADAGGGVRLWPALDGSEEPRVVALPEPHALALGTRDGGYTAAVIDAAGGLYLARLDAHGTGLAHVSLAAEPAFLGIAMSSRGLVAWRADQTIARLDDAGATRAQLASPPGERIVAMAVAGAHVAALLERGDGTRGVRDAVLDPPARWSDFVAIGDAAGAAVTDQLALAPSGSRIAVRAGDDALVLDRAGTLVDNIRVGGAGPLAFADDANLVGVRGGELLWMAIGAGAAAPRDLVGPQLATGGGRVIAGSSSDLVVATAARSQYLGYDVESPAVAQPAGDGQLLIGLGSRFLLLDRTLQAVAQPSFPVTGEVADLRWLGGDAWVVEASTPDDGKTSLALVTGGAATVVRTDLTVAHVLMYEPSTRLVTLSLGPSPSVYRFDPAAHTLVRIAAVAGDPYAQTELVPVAPARAGGTQLLHVTLRDRTGVAWIRDPARPASPASTVTFPGAIAGADAAGHAYGWETAGDRQVLAVYRDGTRTGVLPADGPVSLWPDPAGTRIVELGTQLVTLVGLDGTVRWTRPLSGASQALWLADGTLAVITAAGIARLDPATGDVTAARCGWGFGASATPHPPAPRSEPVCTQLISEPRD